MKEEDPVTVDYILNLIDDQAPVYLSTIDGSIPRVRPVTMVQFESRYFILTGSADEKIKQIRKNNLVEICYPMKGEKGNGYVRMDGSIDIVEDMDLKRSVADHTSYFKDYWDIPEDPTYALLEFNIKNMEFMKPGDPVAIKFKNIG